MLADCYILPYLDSIYKELNQGTNINVILMVGISSIISIMAIALPLLANAVGSLDKRYDSTYVVDVFRKDWNVWLFSIVLCIAVCNIILWTTAYFVLSDEVAHITTIILLATTFLLIISTLCLCLRIVQFKIPAMLFGILKRKEKRLVNPKHYFDRRPNKEMIKENTNFDRKSNRYYSILACLYIEAYSKGNQLQNDIINFWEKKCTPQKPSQKSLSHFSEKNISYMVSLPQCYYYFIREVEKWAHSNAEKQSPCDGVVLLTRILLTGLMPIKIEQINKQIIWIYNYETLKSVWKSMRDSIDNGMELMFCRFWQIINNNALRRYSNSSLPLSNNESLYHEQLFSNKIFFLMCAYLMYRKSYGSLFYAITYTQSSNRRRHVLPNNISELLNTYVDFRDWYSEIQNQHYFSFSDDYKFGAVFEAVHSATWLTALMFVILWQGAKQNGEKLSEQIFFRYPKTENITRYLQYLQTALVQLKDNAEEIEWLKFEGFILDDIPSKEDCENYINAVLLDYDKRLEEDLKKRPVIGNARASLCHERIRIRVQQGKMALEQFNMASSIGKTNFQAAGIQSTSLGKRVFIQELLDTELAVAKMDSIANQWKNKLVIQLREHFIHKTARTIMISAGEKILNDARNLVREKYPTLIQYNNIDALNRYTRDEVKRHLGKPLADAIDKRAGMTAPFTWQVAIVSFIPELKELLGLKENMSRFHGIKIIDCLDSQNISTPLNRDRYIRYLYNSVFIVRKSDLPFINWEAKIQEELINANNLQLLDEKQQLYVGIRHSEDSAQSEISIYRPYEIHTNDKYFIQLKLDLENIKFAS